MKCKICKSEIKGYGHNAEPLVKGQCCDKCNTLVLRKRVIIATKVWGEEK